MSELQLGPWHALPAGGGQALAIDGATLAAASPTHLVAWRDGREIASHAAARRIAGWPRIAGERVLWGDGMLDLADGRWLPARGAEALFEATTPLGTEYATAWAWSPDAQALGCCIAGGRDAGARFVLLDTASGAARTLWRSTDLAPQAAWLGRSGIVLGSRQPQRWGRDGSPAAALGTGPALPALRIESSAGETRLLIADPLGLAVWALPEAERILDCRGHWIDATLTPDGQALFAVDAAGTLQGCTLQPGHAPRPLTGGPPGIAALACDATQLLLGAGRRWHLAPWRLQPAGGTRR
ncbi:MAG TPA: hypothetical protein PKB14_15940 [Rubrivivax sp.]|nr:hypothetical protein [Rubrivivax sp.]